MSVDGLTRRAPISLFIFLFSMSLLEGLDSEETKEKIKQNYLPILLVNWQVRTDTFWTVELATRKEGD